MYPILGRFVSQQQYHVLTECTCCGDLQGSQRTTLLDGASRTEKQSLEACKIVGTSNVLKR